MRTVPHPQATIDRGDPPLGRTLAFGALALLWLTIRLPVRAFLRILEPFVSGFLSLAAVVGIVTACFIRLSGDLPHFPFWGMMGFSVGCMLLLMAYHAVLHLLSQ